MLPGKLTQDRPQDDPQQENPQVAHVVRRNVVSQTGSKKLQEPQLQRRAWAATSPAALESLEERRLLSVNPFSAYANNLATKLAAIQTTLDTTLDTVASLKSLPFIGKQLGKADQVKTVVDQVGNQVQSVLASFSSNGVQPSDLQNQLYQALGPGGLNLLGGDNNGPNSASTTSDIHVSNFTTFGSGLLRTANVEMRLHENATAGFAIEPDFHPGAAGDADPDRQSRGHSPHGRLRLRAGHQLQRDPGNTDLHRCVEDGQRFLAVALGAPTGVSRVGDAEQQCLADGRPGPADGNPRCHAEPANSLSAQVTVDGLGPAGSPTVAFSGKRRRRSHGHPRPGRRRGELPQRPAPTW